MKRVQLGNMFVMLALVGGLHQALRAKAPTRERVEGQTTQADVDAIFLAEAKRERKATKLRGAK